MTEPCQVCRNPAEDRCVRCEKPTCDEHFFEQEHYGVCEPCRQELDAGEQVTNWPYPLRKPIPGAPTQRP